MSLKSQVTRILINSIPETILNRSLKNEEFLSFAELGNARYSDLGVFDHDQILTMLQAAHEGNCSVILINLNGSEFELERLDEGIRVTPLEEGVSRRFVPEFEFLDPVADVRLKALREASAACLPSLISESHWQSILAEHPLTEYELTHLVSDIRQSPSQFITELGRKWHRGEVTSKDLFPTSLAYYEALVGPRPKGHDAGSYIKEVLIPHQERLLSRSLEIGLAYVLPTNIDRRLSPVDLVADIPPDALLDALSTISHSSSPFVQVGALEIALSRINADKRFAEVAEKIAPSLMEGSLSGMEEANYFQLMIPLAQACLRWISVEEELWGAPPFWRRLVAFTHAHFLVEVLITQSFDVESFAAKCDSIKTPGMETAELLDMQKEPLWPVDGLSQISLRAKIIGDLVVLNESSIKKGVAFPTSLDIDAMVDELKKQGGLIFINSPGPMEGSQRLSQVEGAEATNSESIADIFKEFLSDLEKEPNGSSWFGLSKSSQMICFDKSLLDNLVRIVGRISFLDKDEDQDMFFKGLASAAYIAAMQPSEEMAEAVVATLLRDATKFRGAKEAKIGYLVILMASAAIIDNKKWLKWMCGRMTDYAFSLPKGSACRQLLEDLKTLQMFFPLSERCFGRARKFASSALY